jgi:hypothetical protein
MPYFQYSMTPPGSSHGSDEKLRVNLPNIGPEDPFVAVVKSLSV